MRALEIVFVVLVSGLLVAQNARGVPRRYVGALAVAGFATVLLSALLGQARWQMTPAYLLFAVSCLLLLKRSFSHVAVRSLGVSFGVLLLAVSAAASLGFPIVALPSPAGPHAVGVTSFSLIDEARDNAFFNAPDEARELYVQIWYPGVITADQPAPRVRTLWEELYRGERDLFTAFSAYLRGIETHSYAGIPLSSAEAQYPAIVFSHAMGSFAEQNTLLMEHLASHGYVVFGISHPYGSMRVVSPDETAIYLDLDKINGVSAQYESVSAELSARLEQAGSSSERTRLQVELYERASGINALLDVWVDDLRFVLDSITTLSGKDPRLQPFVNGVDADRIGLLGMSFGGGAVTQLCKTEPRCSAALNMDGGTFGEREPRPLQAPYLALLRENREFLDYPSAARTDYYEVKVKGATHLDFTDDAVVLPILRWLSITGPVAGERVVEITNVVVLRFFDAYLRGGPNPDFSAALSELTIRTTDYVGE